MRPKSEPEREQSKREELERAELVVKADGNGAVAADQDEPDPRAARLKRSADSEGHADEDPTGAQGKPSLDWSQDGTPLLHDMNAKHDEAQQLEREFRQKLNREARRVVAGSVHEKIRLIVHRPEALPADGEQYRRLAAELAPVVNAIVCKTAPLLEYEVRAEYAGHKTYGTQFQAGRLAAKDYHYFARKRPPQESPSLIVALRIDESASMSAFGRLEAARRAAVAVYEFCSRCRIPILIYGDTADRSRLEQMSMFAYCDSERPLPSDRYRLMRIQARGNNRDGMALRILAEKLLATPYATKLLVSVSDGQPRAVPDYTGTPAINDMKDVLQQYTRQGVTFLAAAIGHDKEVIHDIYGAQRFIDITDLRRFPQRLVAMIARYV